MPFQFQQFSVNDAHTAMKVGTDGVLLGAWAAGECPKRILDIGTGSGVVALMLAQRYPVAHIDAIELEPSAAEAARQNFAHSPWKERLQLYHQDIADYTAEQPYDLIVSNPPFFADSLKNTDSARSRARHQDSLPQQLLFKRSAEMLRTTGKLCLILPADSYPQAKLKAGLHKLYPEKVCWVKPTPEKPPNRVLICYGSELMAAEESALTIRASGGSYTLTYQGITKGFYL